MSALSPYLYSRWRSFWIGSEEVFDDDDGSGGGGVRVLEEEEEESESARTEKRGFGDRGVLMGIRVLGRKEVLVLEEEEGVW